jgi:hypothetical protein
VAVFACKEVRQSIERKKLARNLPGKKAALQKDQKRVIDGEPAKQV